MLTPQVTVALAGQTQLQFYDPVRVLPPATKDIGDRSKSLAKTILQQMRLGLERIHQVTNTIRIANIGWRIRICIREYTFFSEAINFIRQCSKFHTVIMLSNFINLIKTIIEMNEFYNFFINISFENLFFEH